jgi:hypothetical protein
MQICIVTNPPALRIDSSEGSRLAVGRACEVQSCIGDCLLVAGCAVPNESDSNQERSDFDSACTR